MIDAQTVKRFGRNVRAVAHHFVMTADYLSPMLYTRTKKSGDRTSLIRGILYESN